MKQVVMCEGCGLITRRYGCFTAELQREEVIGGVATGRMVKKRIYLCPKCAARAGYKVRDSQKGGEN